MTSTATQAQRIERFGTVPPTHGLILGVSSCLAFGHMLRGSFICMLDKARQLGW